MHLSQIARERKSSKDQVFHALGVILLLLTVIGILLALFYRLDASGLADTDEEWHATNAWEMFQSENWTINTHFGSVDYFNSKPPLNLRAILLSFHLLGVSFFSFKLVWRDLTEGDGKTYSRILGRIGKSACCPNSPPDSSPVYPGGNRRPANSRRIPEHDPEKYLSVLAALAVFYHSSDSLFSDRVIF